MACILFGLSDYQVLRVVGAHNNYLTSDLEGRVKSRCHFALTQCLFILVLIYSYRLPSLAFCPLLATSTSLPVHKHLNRDLIVPSRLQP